MKKWKTIVGILLIIISLTAIYFWNTQGRALIQDEKLASVIPDIDPREDVIKGNESYFSIPNDWVFSKTVELRTGDLVSIYTMDTRELIGCFKVTTIGSETTEIVCKIEDYFRIIDSLHGMQNLLFVLEDINV